MSGDALTLLGREFEGFRRAVAAHAGAWAAGTVSARWLGLPELEREVLSGTPDADLVLVPADWLPALAHRGTVVPLDEHLADRPPHGWPDAWMTSFRDGVGYDGALWGLPLHDGPQLLFRRTDLYAAHGLAAPRTWQELADHAVRLHDPDRCSGTVLAGAPDGHNNVYDFVLHLWRYGGDLLEGDRVVLDGVPARRALAFLRDLATGPVTPRAHELDSNGSGAELAAGRVAVAVNWAGYAALAADGPVAADVATAVVPVHDDGTPTTTVNAFWALAVTATCTRPTLAWDYLRHSTSAAMDLRTTASGASGARRSTWADPEVLRERPEHASFEAAHAHSRPLPRVHRLPEVVQVLNELVDAVIWRGASADPALAAAHARIEAVLEPASAGERR